MPVGRCDRRTARIPPGAEPERAGTCQAPADDCAAAPCATGPPARECPALPGRTTGARRSSGDQRRGRSADEPAAVRRIQEVLDRHVLANVHINPESRVRVEQGSARPDLVQGGTRVFLVKVLNEAGVTAPLVVESPNTGRVYVPSRNSPEPRQELTDAHVRERWAEISVYNKAPMRPRLSGLGIEYVILQVYSRDVGQRSALMGFSVGQGSQDIGFRNDIDVLFTAGPRIPCGSEVRDELGAPTTAGFLIGTSSIASIRTSRSAWPRTSSSSRRSTAGRRGDSSAGWLLHHHRVARAGVSCRRRRRGRVAGPQELSFALERWIDPSRDGWYSGDHHIHSAGCSHYENPTEGVTPEDMWPQINGEALNLASVLIWGPSVLPSEAVLHRPGSRALHAEPADAVRRRDLGFPSSHAGHLVLLGLKDQDYPGAKRLEDWPSWDLPILRWAKAQGAVVGFAHSGWGLEVKSRRPAQLRGAGLRRHRRQRVHRGRHASGRGGLHFRRGHAVVWELNIWYHTLNVGFRTRISGETDFPCITDDRVGSRDRTQESTDP